MERTPIELHPHNTRLNRERHIQTTEAPRTDRRPQTRLLSTHKQSHRARQADPHMPMVNTWHTPRTISRTFPLDNRWCPGRSRFSTHAPTSLDHHPASTPGDYGRAHRRDIGLFVIAIGRRRIDGNNLLDRDTRTPAGHLSTHIAILDELVPIEVTRLPRRIRPVALDALIARRTTSITKRESCTGNTRGAKEALMHEESQCIDIIDTIALTQVIQGLPGAHRWRVIGRKHAIDK